MILKNMLADISDSAHSVITTRKTDRLAEKLLRAAPYTTSVKVAWTGPLNMLEDFCLTEHLTLIHIGAINQPTYQISWED